MKNLYMIPGWCDTTGRKPYCELYNIAQKKGYNVIKKNPDWDTPLSKQLFPIKKGDVIFGFSLGAVFACMVAQKYPHKKLIAASMSPVLDMPDSALKILGNKVAKDCKKFKYGGAKAVYLYGEGEIDKSLNEIKKMGIKIVPNCSFRLNSEYVEYISREL